MTENLLYMVAVLCSGFLLSRSVMQFLLVNDLSQGYQFRKDPWFYILALLSLGFTVLYFVMPDFYDFIVPFKLITFSLWLVLALVIYFIYLFFDSDWIRFCSVALAALLLVFMLPKESVIFLAQYPFWVDRLLLALIITVFCYGVSLLFAIDGILAMQMVFAYLGVGAIALLGGVPILLGLMGVYGAGVWFGYWHVNRFPAQVFINQGAAVSAGFVLSGLLLQGVVELAGASMLLLIMFVVAELIFVFVNRYVLNEKTPDIYENTCHCNVYYNGVDLGVLSFGIFKVLIFNVIFALFQLYSPNAYSLPIFALLVNLWLLNIMDRVSAGEDISLWGANKEVIKNIKQGLEKIKSHNQKDKD